MRQVQWKSLAGLATAGCALIGASLPAEAAHIAAQTGPFSLIVPAAQIDPNKKCITVGGQEFCLVKKKKSDAPAGQAPGNPAPQGGNGGPQRDEAGQAGGTGGGNAAPQDDAGVAGGGNAGASAGADANANLEPGEHVCPVGYLVLATESKFGAFCEEVKGFPVPAGMESVERACPAGSIVRAIPNEYKALCGPKEGFPN